MERRMDILMSMLNDVMNGGSDDKGKIYLASCLKKLKRYALTDTNAFTVLAKDIGTTYTGEYGYMVQNAVIEFLLPISTSLEKDALALLYVNYPRIVGVMSKFLIKHQLDESLSELIAENFMAASSRSRNETNDMSLVVSMLVYAMQNMVIPNTTANSAIVHLLSILSSKSIYISLDMIETALCK